MAKPAFLIVWTARPIACVTSAALSENPAGVTVGARRVEGLGEQRPGLFEGLRGEPGHRLAPQHRAGAVEVESTVPRVEDVARRTEVDRFGRKRLGAVVEEDLGNVHQRIRPAGSDDGFAEEHRGLCGVVERRRADLVGGEVAVVAGEPERIAVGEHERVLPGAHRLRDVLFAVEQRVVAVEGELVARNPEAVVGVEDVVGVG